jgi:uncharacterized protein involved in outer membrane biogenesis
MKTALRILAIGAAAIGALLAMLLLYLAFGDLGRHKERIGKFVSAQIGRPFVIEGPFDLDIFPAVELQADDVHIANVAWGSTPQMLQVGHFATTIDLWSLVSGPVIVRTLELRDVTVALEKNDSGENNWTFSDPNAPPEPEVRTDEGMKKLPVAFHNARLQNLLVTYRSPGEQVRQARIDSLTVLPGTSELLAIEGKGSLDEYAAAISGEAGPLESLVAGRNIRMAIGASLGNLRMDAKGSFGSLYPLDGADLKLTVDNPDVGTMFRKLRVPVLADGPMHVQATMADAGERTRIDLQARAGDLSADVSGSLAVLGLRDSELDIKAQALDAARLATVLGMHRVPAEKLDIAAHLFITHTRRRPVGRAVRGTVKASLGDLSIDAKGNIGHLHPLEVTELALTADEPDVGSLLRDLQFPVVAEGPMHLEGSLATEGKRKRVQLHARAGDLTTDLNGTFAAAGQRNPEVEISAEVLDASRLAEAFDIQGVPAVKLLVAGHVAVSPEQLKLAGVSASLGDARLKLDGAIARTGERSATTRFDFSTDNLAELKQGLPVLQAKVSGDLVSTPDQFEFPNLSAVLGKTQLQGSAKIGRTLPRHLEAVVSSPLLDLTPLFAKSPEAEAEAGAKPEAAPKPAKKEHMFPATPLPLEKLQEMDARLQLAAGELQLGKLLLKAVDVAVTVRDGQVHAQTRANGGYSGNLDGTFDLVPTSAGAATLKVELNLKDVRAGAAGDDTVKPDEVPPTTLVADLASSGDSPHALASNINGSFLYSLGPGKTRKGALGKIGGDVIAQLFSKLNPFQKDDPHTELDCAVARIDFKSGKATLAPLLMQTKKVTVTADGTLDLDTEALALNFDTRPRSGIGISPGMFTNPFLELRGTLASPAIGVGAKGMTSGALAAATAGATVVAKGLMDRVKGEVDQCRKTLEEAQHPSKAARKAPAEPTN